MEMETEQLKLTKAETQEYLKRVRNLGYSGSRFSNLGLPIKYIDGEVVWRTLDDFMPGGSISQLDTKQKEIAIEQLRMQQLAEEMEKEVAVAVAGKKQKKDAA